MTKVEQQAFLKVGRVYENTPCSTLLCLDLGFGVLFAQDTSEPECA